MHYYNAVTKVGKFFCYGGDDAFMSPGYAACFNDAHILAVMESRDTCLVWRMSRDVLFSCHGLGSRLVRVRLVLALFEVSMCLHMYTVAMSESLAHLRIFILRYTNVLIVISHHVLCIMTVSLSGKTKCLFHVEN